VGGQFWVQIVDTQEGKPLPRRGYFGSPPCIFRGPFLSFSKFYQNLGALALPFTGGLEANSKTSNADPI